MSQINKELMKKIAKNAMLDLSDAEIKEFLPQLEEILSYFKELDSVSTKNVEPSFHPIKIKNALREDIPESSLTKEEIFSLTEHKKDSHFKGPKVI
ncbi:Asp-tRNA(Asn)/Glu-tRNA(Gln) amidotransferase subunit GatC [Candidatus Woesearchaeota archaeon]|nr:Asp-tRNA(Asn)/Glu-tRNA(Gln) amidotransferase subunit GatC [Candidatus Woesearchaeota archaeon]